jgi:hypothetical protein
MRDVAGVQSLTPVQVSRTKTCRNPLFTAVLEFLLAAADLAFSWLAVIATKATNLPDPLTDGRIASVPTKAPCASVEISWVAGTHEDAAPTQVSRK